MIYLASPYSHPDAFVRERRFQAACEVAARLMQDGHHVFSPIAHSHAIAVQGIPTDWTYWKTFDSHMLAACGELAVLMLPGWRDSEGVQAEIDLAIELDLPIRFLDPIQDGLVQLPVGADT
jgi:hypothetical protein